MENEKLDRACILIAHIHNVLSNLSVELNNFIQNPSVSHQDPQTSLPEHHNHQTPIIQDIVGELLDYGVTLPYSLSMYDEKCLREKANYYFSNKASISNKKAYLNKLVASLQIKTETPSKSGSENRKTDGFSESFEESEERRREERRIFLEPFLSELSDNMIEETLRGNTFLRNYCKTLQKVRETPAMEYAILDMLVKSGRIK